MTLHKWGKFERKVETTYELVPEAYNVTVEMIDEHRFESMDFNEKTGQVIVSRHSHITEGANDSGYIPVAKSGYGYVATEFWNRDGILIISKFKFERAWDSGGNRHDSVYGVGTVYVVKENHRYFKGSRLDTVTSTNRNAYPNDGQSGSYWYVYEGIANQTPTISGKDEDLGGFKAPFKRVFSVDDPDGNETLNVTVKLNSATIRTINNATKGESYEIDIDKAKFDELELNKQNTIEITVSDSNGASAIRRYTFKKVNSNPVVTVTNSNLGEQNKPFNFNFKAADPDGDDITAKVYIDDVQVQDLGKVTPNQAKTVSIGKLDYAKLLNGEHRIKIEATDSFGAKGTGYITFTKKITHCWYRLTKEVDAQPSAVVVNPLTELAKGAKMTVKVSLNAKDTNPTWEVVPDDFIGQKYNFKTKTKTADKWCIGVDIRIDRADTPEGMESYFYGFVGAYM